MRKIFSKLAIILTTSSLAFPLAGCVYNFYINSAQDAVVKSLANQTSSVIKSLVLSKEKSTDTSQTIKDILAEFPNYSITDQTNGASLNTWEDFSASWGVDGNIATTGFDPNEYFKATGSGTVTQQVNSYRDLNNVLSQVNLVSGLSAIDNSILYNLVAGDLVKPTIIDFLNQTKETNPNNASTIIKLLKNTIVGTDWANPSKDAFKNNFINPLTSLLNYLIKGWWAPNQGTPTNKEEFKEFMTNWKDPEGKPYSQWNDGNNWTLNEEIYKDWNENDFNFYRGGTLINYLFYKIGKDNNLTWPKSGEYKDRYLGDIILDHLAIPFPADELLEDLNQYFDCLLTNPAYILTLIEGIIPILKTWGLGMDNLTPGVEKLTFGKIYPDNPSQNSYNVLNILDRVQELLNNPGGENSEPGTLRYVIESLVGLNQDWTIGNSFTYDVTLKIGGDDNASWFPLGLLLKTVPKLVEPIITELLSTLQDSGITSIFDNIINIAQKWIKQYDDRNEGISLDLTKLQDFLLNENTGLVTAINRDLVLGTPENSGLYGIMTDENPIDPSTPEGTETYIKFYESLGGYRPKADGVVPNKFRENSAIDILKKKIDKIDEPLGQLALILIGNSSTEINGLFTYIIESNNQWISDNYTTFFDANNKSIGQIYNLSMTTNNNGDIISDTLSYTFKYKINDTTYTFWIKAKSSDKADEFTGAKNFKFIEIKKI